MYVSRRHYLEISNDVLQHIAAALLDALPQADIGLHVARRLRELNGRTLGDVTA